MKLTKLCVFASALVAAWLVCADEVIDKTINLNVWGSDTLTVQKGTTCNLKFTGDTTTATLNKAGDGNVVVDNQSFSLSKWFWKGSGVLTMTGTTLNIGGNFESYGYGNWQTNIFNNCTMTVSGTFNNECTRNSKLSNVSIFNGGTYGISTLLCDGNDSGSDGGIVIVRGDTELNISKALYGHRAMGGSGHARFVQESGTVTVASTAEISLSWAFNVRSGAIELLGGTFTAPYIGGGNSQDDYVLGNGVTWIVNKNTSDLVNGTVEHVYVGENGLKISTDYAGTTLARNIENWGDETGFLEKLGTGTLTLTGKCSTHGETIVSEGTLVLGAAVTNHAAITAKGGTTLDLTQISDGVVLGGLSLNGTAEAPTALKAVAGKTVDLATANFNLGTVALDVPDITTVGTVYNIFRMPGQATEAQSAAWAAIPIAEVAEIEHVLAATYDEESDTTTFSLSVNKDMNVTRQIMITAGEGGSVDFTSGKYKVETPLVVTATPDEGYTFVSWSGELPSGCSADNPVLSFSVGDEDVTLEASFVQTYASGPVDLTDGDVTIAVANGGYYIVTELTGNSSANLTFVGKGGVLLPDTVAATDYATITLDGAKLTATSEAAFGGGIILKGGAELTFDFDIAYDKAKHKTITIADGETATTIISEGRSVCFGGNGAPFVQKNATWIKRGAGVVAITGQSSTEKGTWIIEEGTLQPGGYQWFGTKEVSTCPAKVIEVHENGVLNMTYTSSGGYICEVGNVILRGGLLKSANTNAGSTDITRSPGYNYLYLNGKVTAIPSSSGKASRIESMVVTLAGYMTSMEEGFGTAFDVQEGAALIVDAMCSNASDLQIPSVLYKVGPGTMTLLRSPRNTGLISVKEGALKLGPGVMIDPAVQVQVAEGASLELADQAILTAAGGTDDAFIATADAWFDAAKVDGVDGGLLQAVPNRGTCGGMFMSSGNFMADYGYQASFPIFKATGINNLPSCSFTQTGYLLNTLVDTGSEMTVYCVSQWAGWGGNGLGKNSAPFGVANNYDSYENTFSLRYEAADTAKAYFAGNTAAKMVSVTTGATSSGAPVLEKMTRTATGGTFTQYAGEGKEVLSASYEGTLPALNITRLVVGSRVYNSSIGFRSANNDANTTFNGLIGEVIVFNRALTADEDAYVQAYLKNKWFNAGLVAIKPKAETVRTLPISVADGATAAFAGTVGTNGTAALRIEKLGKGRLDICAEINSAADIQLKEGALGFGGGAISAAAIWLDAADAETVVMEGDSVASVKNKGFGGGAFAPATATMPTLTTFGTRNAVKFNGNSTLQLTGYALEQTNRQMNVYLVRKTDVKSNYSFPFLFTSKAGLETAAGNEQPGCFAVWHQDTSTALTLGWSKNDSIANVAHPDTEAAELDVFQLLPRMCTYKCYGATDDPIATGFSARGYGRSTSYDTHIDCWHLGSHIKKGEQYAQNWNGTIAELIVIPNHLPMNAERELLAYLRKKWFDEGDGSTTPPKWLAGASGVSGKGDIVLDQKADTSLVQDGPTVALASLTMAEGATLARTTKCTGEALFDVAGKLTAEGPVNVALTPFPHGDQTLVTYGTADISGSVEAWPALRKSGTATGLVHQDVANNLIYICGPGLMFIVK